MASFLLAAGISLAWCAIAIRIGPSIGFVDRPDDPSLKAHERPAVPLGGVGVFLGVHAAMAVAGAYDPGLLAATSIVLVLGLVDDRQGLSPVARLGAEVAAAVTLVALADGPLDPTSPTDLVAGVVLVVVFINAVNLFDGLDGLVGASGVVSAFGLAWLAGLRGTDLTPAVAVAGALGGFLVLNWHPAKVFLGDNGAYTVGMFLAYGTLVASPDGAGVGLGVASVGLGVFALDLIATVIRRRLGGNPLFAGDRSHLYDQLRDRGMRVPTIAITAAFAQTLFVLVSIGLEVAELGNWSWLLIAVMALGLLSALGVGGFLRPGQAG